jgi:uncharacterized protein
MCKFVVRCSFLLLMSLGFEMYAIGQESKARYPRPTPQCKVRLEQSVMVPMRDGTRLSTDLYFPEDRGDKLPVILIRTPYNKTSYRQETSVAFLFAGQRYVVAVQDVRGKYESEGQYAVWAASAQDGYDAVDWLARQPWCNSKIGTFGCSYTGKIQIDSAKLRNPHLAAMIPQGGHAAFRFTGLFAGGVLELANASQWFVKNGSKIKPILPADTPQSQFVQAAKYFSLAPVLPDISFQILWKRLPLIDMLKNVGIPPTDWEGFNSHEPTDSWWDQFGRVQDTDRFDVPSLFIDSWYDSGPADTLDLFNFLQKNSLSSRARENQFAIIAPVTHCKFESATEQTIVGERNVGNAQYDFYNTYVRWFDFWLKGIENGITKMPKLQIYVMGKNQWRGEQEWPLTKTQFTHYYLRSKGRANSQFGDGTLDTVLPDTEPSDTFTYDPKTPVPTVGLPNGGLDQSEVETRADVLVYTTPVLDRGIEVSGPIKAVLYVSSSARDTDFTAKLVDVYPDGVAYNIHEGILRARYREGFGKKVWMKPGQIYQVKIDMQATSNYFAAGHRIRLEISSSNFPRFTRNLNTGGNNYDETEWKVAQNQIHHRKDYASHLILPIIP